MKQLNTTIKALEDENKEKDRLVEELKSNIGTLEQEIKATDEKVAFLENTEKELRREARDNFSKWNEKEKELNRLLKEQIEGMNKTKRN